MKPLWGVVISHADTYADISSLFSAPVSRPILSAANTLSTGTVLGQKFLLRCYSSLGTLPINYTLYKGDTVITWTQVTKNKSAEFTETATDKPVQGEYRCEAQNGHSLMRQSNGLNITVIGEYETWRVCATFQSVKDSSVRIGSWKTDWPFKGFLSCLQHSPLKYEGHFTLPMHPAHTHCHVPQPFSPETLFILVCSFQRPLPMMRVSYSLPCPSLDGGKWLCTVLHFNFTLPPKSLGQHIAPPPS